MAEETNPPLKHREREFAAVSYLWIFSLLILLGKRESHFVQHHARQGFFLFVMSLLLWIFPVTRYGEFVILLLMIMGFINATMGNEFHIPIIREISDGTLRLFHLKRYWHHTKHGAIKIVKREHIAPKFMDELKEQHKELSDQEKMLDQEKRMLEMEEKKLSALQERLREDEKHIDRLADEVRILEVKMEKEHPRR